MSGECRPSIIPLPCSCSRLTGIWGQGCLGSCRKPTGAARARCTCRILWPCRAAGTPVLQVARPLHYQLLRHFTWSCRYGAAVCLRNAVCRRCKGSKSPTSRHGKAVVRCKGVSPRLPQPLVLVDSSHRSPAATRPAVPVLPPASKRWLLTTNTRGHNSWWSFFVQIIFIEKVNELTNNKGL